MSLILAKNISEFKNFSNIDSKLMKPKNHILLEMQLALRLPQFLFLMINLIYLLVTRWVIYSGHRYGLEIINGWDV